ncbi:MAG: helix-turn-helix domain-containing protein [Fulvivirga sp.]|nr:helix-turn-helix domain-containing protein [Fulvivirga sp.]
MAHFRQSNYREFLPAENLLNYVECYYYLYISQKDSFSDNHIILPDGSSEVIFNCGLKYSKLPFDGLDATYAALPARSYIIGQKTKSFVMKYEGDNEVWGIRFKPYGLYTFLGSSLDDAEEKQIDSESIWPEIRSLEEQIFLSTSLSHMKKLTDEFLSHSFKVKHYSIPTHIMELAKVIVNTKGTAPVRTVFRNFAKCPRSLEIEFKKYTGLTTKSFSNLIRLGFSRILVSNNRSLSEIAYSCGYFDQSHFIRQFKKFTGMPPGRFKTTRHLNDMHLSSLKTKLAFDRNRQ